VYLVVDVAGRPQTLTVTVNDDRLALAHPVDLARGASEGVQQQTAFAISHGRTNDRQRKITAMMRLIQNILAQNFVGSIGAVATARLGLNDWITAGGFAVDIDRTTKDQVSRPAFEGACRAVRLFRREADHVDHAVPRPGLGHLRLKCGEVVTVAVDDLRSALLEASLALAAIVQREVDAAAP
jgi:hypothetical protein